MPRKTGKLNFEEALKELEALVQSMEQGELSLEESLKAFERGVELTRSCQQSLEEAEQKVEILTQKQGVLAPQPFAAQSDDG